MDGIPAGVGIVMAGDLGHLGAMQTTGTLVILGPGEEFPGGAGLAGSVGRQANHGGGRCPRAAGINGLGLAHQARNVEDCSHRDLLSLWNQSER